MLLDFRAAHLLLNFFPRADGYPFVCLQLEEAEPVRSEVERAILFDTLPLVNRFNEAVSRALRVCEEAGGIGAET